MKLLWPVPAKLILLYPQKPEAELIKLPRALENQDVAEPEG